MWKEIRPAVVMLVVMTVLTGIAYPLAITGIAQALFPHQADGSLIHQDGKVIGSELIGQTFASDKYFHGRPSAAGNGYDASNSSGTNLGPTSKALIDAIKTRVKAAEKENPGASVPVDLVTSSASGLDPDITPAAALFQVPAVAKARHLSEAAVRALVERHIQGRVVGLIGESEVNVLELNQALDQLSAGK
jgi:K+-transporting ATPase ATPase C chain